MKRVPRNAGYNSFKYLLLDTELQRLAEYERKWYHRFGWSAKQDPDCIFHLGDNPESMTCWSTGGRFPSLRKSMGILYHPMSETIITPRERLAIMGWPVYPMLASAACLRPFDFPDVKRGSKHAGNAYQVSTFGMWLVTMLGCLRIVD